MNEQKKKIKDEIERRMNLLWERLPDAHTVVDGTYSKEDAIALGKYTALESFETFIDSLEENTVDYDKLKTALHDALEKETKESWDAFLEDEPDCAWYNNGECKKGLPGTKCEVAGCVAKTPSALQSRLEKDAIDEGFTKFMEKGSKGKDCKISKEICQNFTKPSEIPTNLEEETHYTKTNALFDKSFANADPDIVKKVWEHMDKELQEESSKALEAADAYIVLHYNRAHGTPTLTECFMAGAEWQKKQDSKKVDPSEIYGSFVLEVQTEKDMEEAATKCAEQYRPHWPNQVKPAHDAFIQGADWQKKQDEKDLTDKVAAAYQLGSSDAIKKLKKNCNIVDRQYAEIEQEKKCQGCFDRDEVFHKGIQHAKEEMMKEAIPFREILKAVPAGPERDITKILILKDDETSKD